MPSQPYRCPVCNGTGQVLSTFYQEVGNTTAAIHSVQCRSCGGSGIVWSPKVTVSIPSVQVGESQSGTSHTESNVEWTIIEGK